MLILTVLVSVMSTILTTSHIFGSSRTRIRMVIPLPHSDTISSQLDLKISTLPSAFLGGSAPHLIEVLALLLESNSRFCPLTQHNGHLTCLGVSVDLDVLVLVSPFWMSHFSLGREVEGDLSSRCPDLAVYLSSLICLQKLINVDYPTNLVQRATSTSFVSMEPIYMYSSSLSCLNLVYFAIRLQCSVWHLHRKGSVGCVVSACEHPEKLHTLILTLGNSSQL